MKEVRGKDGQPFWGRHDAPLAPAILVTPPVSIDGTDPKSPRITARVDILRYSEMARYRLVPLQGRQRPPGAIRSEI